MTSTATQTEAQQFAAAYAADMARQMLRTIRLVRWFATAIMLIAMVTSYSHQAMYLAGIGAPKLGAWLIPLAVDALTALCVKVTGTPGMAAAAKRMALRVLVFPVLASGAVNFVAPGALVVKVVFVVAVLMIPAAELVAGKIKPDFAAMDTMERDITPAPAAKGLQRPLAAERVYAARMSHPTANIATIARIAGVQPSTARKHLATVPTSPAPAGAAA